MKYIVYNCMRNIEKLTTRIEKIQNFQLLYTPPPFPKTQRHSVENTDKFLLTLRAAID